MLSYKIIVTVIAGILSVVCYAPYLKDIFAHRTKPHIFSWFTWSVLMSIAFAAQIVSGGGAGSWVTLTEGIACIGILLLSFRYGEKEITISDWISLTGAFIGAVLWVVTKNPFWAVIFVTTADAFGFIPTFRKSFAKPDEETPTTYLLISISFILALTAFDTYTFTTILYTAYLAVANGVFWMYIMIRRIQLKQSHA